MKKVAFHTLGCKLNFSETATISRQFTDAEFTAVNFLEDVADVYVINTCSVTENADKECKQLIRRVKRKAPNSFVVITGCYAQLKPQEIVAIDGVDLVLGASEKFNILKHVNSLIDANKKQAISCEISSVDDFTSSFSLHERTRVFLKVQDGCNYNCSFCTIPLARGKSRSNSIENVVAEVKKIAASGVKEIILTGINLGDFGNSDENFLMLLQTLDALDVIQRYRISSIEPNLLSDDIIAFVAQSKHIMHHFHIPLQSGSNKILGLMRRRYQKELYASRIQTIKKLMPFAAIGVDVIVGFPGETDADFMETYEFLKALDISYLHVFTYSERNQTKALEITLVVPQNIRNERNKILRQLSFEKQQQFYKACAGQTREVLFEEKNKAGFIEGYTDNYIKVEAAYNPRFSNQIVSWQL